MNTQIVVVGLAALLVGGFGGYALAGQTASHMMPDGTMMDGIAQGGMQGEMEAMMQALSGKTGDEFDKAFLSEMIIHHQGAVAMAEAALENGGHEEIKTMARAIIAAQTAEIAQMQEWQETWYGVLPPVTSGDRVMPGSAVHDVR